MKLVKRQMNEAQYRKVSKLSYSAINTFRKDRNAFYKFDVRNMFKLPDGTHAQKGRTDTKADKMVLEFKDQWVILDIEELLSYIRKHKVKKVYVNDLISDLEWTIFLAKN